jgi:SAM-dependent methyltransferase
MRLAAARRGDLTARSALALLAREPALLPEVARILTGAARSAVFDNNALISLLDGARARRAVPDVATGVGWYDEQPFLEALQPHLGSECEALELGCGGGRISRRVAPDVRRLTGTDPSRAMIGEAAENLAAFANVSVRLTDGFSLAEFSDRSFDLVFGQGVLGYLDPNPLLALLDEIHRVLRPGGASVFNFLTIDHPANLAVHLDTVRRQARRRRFHGGTDRAYTLGQLRALHEAVGLQPLGPAGEIATGRVVLSARRNA